MMYYFLLDFILYADKIIVSWFILSIFETKIYFGVEILLIFDKIFSVYSTLKKSEFT
jgi:hypothetical protein